MPYQEAGGRHQAGHYTIIGDNPFLSPAAISLVANGVLLTSGTPAANWVLWCPGRE